MGLFTVQLKYGWQLFKASVNASYNCITHGIKRNNIMVLRFFRRRIAANFGHNGTAGKTDETTYGKTNLLYTTNYTKI